MRPTSRTGGCGLATQLHSLSLNQGMPLASPRAEATQTYVSAAEGSHMFLRTTRTFGAAGVVALALVVAQVALAEVPVSRFTAADQAAAKAAVVRLSDFAAGAGWKGGLEKNTKPFAGEDCPGLWEPKQGDLVITGVARSDFRGAGAHLASGAQVYETARMAQLDWDRTVALPAALACMKKQAAAAQTPAFRLVSIKKIPFPRFGQRTLRTRTIVDYTPAGGKTVRMLTDDVMFGRGRTGVAFSFTAPYTIRAAAGAAELRIAQTLYSRIRV
jgi:hypothetical protein